MEVIVDLDVIQPYRLVEVFGPWAIALVLLMIGIVYLYKRNEYKTKVIEKQSQQHIELLNRLITAKTVEAEINKDLTKVLESVRLEIKHGKELHEKSIQSVKEIISKT